MVNTKYILEKILDHSLDVATALNPKSDLYQCKNIFIFNRNDTIISQKAPINYFYILISGNASVWNQITWNDNNIVSYLTPLEILGLIEYLNNTSFYTADVIAETKCLVYRIPAKHFIQTIKDDSHLCFLTLSALGNVTAANMINAEKSSLFHYEDILGHYLFLEATPARPYTSPLTRVQLANRLNINIRTLYRYINLLRDKHYLQLITGKIVIDDHCYKLLAQKYESLIL